MNEQMGLAQSMAPQQGQQRRLPSLEEVIALLQQGVSPEELMAAGVPLEMLEAAIRQMQGQQPKVQEAPMDAGMAQMMAGR